MRRQPTCNWLFWASWMLVSTCIIKPLSRVSSLTASVLQLSKLNDVSIRTEAVNLVAVSCRLGLDQT
jgi:hypothetical protein